jgi:hypothetical protein
LINFSPDFIHVILSYLDELISIPYMVENLEIYSFHLNFNRNKIPLVAPYMSLTVHEGLV